MKKIAFLVYLLFQCTCLSYAAEVEDYTIQGRHYVDGMPVLIKVSNGMISQIIRQDSEDPKQNLYVAPGLIDIQINGYLGVDFSGPDLTLEGIRKATKALWKEGVTSYLPTVITSAHSRLLKNFTIMAKALDDSEIGNSIPGFHLEGPYISPVQGFRGAHLEKYIRPPNWEEFSEYQNASKNGIKLVTVAPEMEGALLFISKCSEQGIIVSLGHHNASTEIIRQAVDAGASLATHLGNGCANMINRHHNPLWPQLAEDRLSISIITDGYHLTREEIRSFYKIKGSDHTILISDALDLAGLPPGEYIRGERKVVLTPHVVKFPAEDVLAGAASPVSHCLGNMIRFTQCSLGDAIKMASTNPAKLMKLDDVGELRQGKRADLILFSIEEGKIVIYKTIVAGKVVYTK